MLSSALASAEESRHRSGAKCFIWQTQRISDIQVIASTTARSSFEALKSFASLSSHQLWPRFPHPPACLRFGTRSHGRCLCTHSDLVVSPRQVRVACVVNLSADTTAKSRLLRQLIDNHERDIAVLLQHGFESRIVLVVVDVVGEADTQAVFQCCRVQDCRIRPGQESTISTPCSGNATTFDHLIERV